MIYCNSFIYLFWIFPTGRGSIYTLYYGAHSTRCAPFIFMNLTYKLIPWLDNSYLINEYWQVYSMFRNRHLTACKINTWYLTYRLKPNASSKYTRYLVHRLVMSAFFWESNLEVNHKDGNKLNNHISNLEYCTRSENHLHKCNVLWIKPVWTKWKRWTRKSKLSSDNLR